MLLRSVISVFFLAASSLAVADYYPSTATYEVTITNITRGQTFTPQLVVAHSRKVQLFDLGEPASDELATLAESGNTQPLTDVLLNAGNKVGEVKTVDGLLLPGKSVTTTITTNPRKQFFISLAAMLIPTNDTFVSLNKVRLPFYGKKTVMALAYDAGSELNDQNCLNIPGPRCGGAGDSAPADTDEGYVYVSNGFHELGSVDAAGNEILGPAVYDWRNPVAKVTIRRVY